VNSYIEKLSVSSKRCGSNLCIGLDPDLSRIPHDFLPHSAPEDRLVAFCNTIVDLTRPFAAAYKPNVAFFEALGAPAFSAFDSVVKHIGGTTPVIADAKRGDIGNTGRQYRIAFFDAFGVDALTVNPWMGMDTLEPYLDAPGKAIYVLVLTSNPGSADFMRADEDTTASAALKLTRALHERNKSSETHIGMVVGATKPALLPPFLEAHTDASLLIPGFGAQGGDADAVINLLATHHGLPLLNVSRDILYPVNPDGHWKDNVVNAASIWSKKLLVSHGH
jgi:orotidine-5'-phosphate decarboxylase